MPQNEGSPAGMRSGLCSGRSLVKTCLHNGAPATSANAWLLDNQSPLRSVVGENTWGHN